MAFVLFRQQQHFFWILFCSSKNTICFVPMSTTWLSKPTSAGKARKGCVNPHTPGSHQTSITTSIEWLSDKATELSDLGPIKTWRAYLRSWLSVNVLGRCCWLTTSNSLHLYKEYRVSASGWPKLAAFRRTQKMATKFSSGAYILYLQQIRRLCAYVQICKSNSVWYAIYTM